MITFNTNLFIVEVEYWDDEEKRLDTPVILVNGENLASAAEEAEEYFGNTISKCIITPLENGPVVIPYEIAEKIIDGEY